LFLNFEAQLAILR